MMVKRALDLLVSVLVLTLAMPFLALLVLAVWMESGAPAIFSQTRIGRRRQRFRCHKIRTMVAASPELPSHEIASSYITPLGRVLRKTKLDELPQLWNVALGEMSLVGPRPCLPSQLALIEARDARGVFEIVPGITGLAQIQGVDMSDPERLAIVDQQYTRDQSFMLDLKIVFRTFF